MRNLSPILAFLLTALPVAGHVQADPVPAGYRTAAAEARVGPALFYAIALTESGQSTMTAGYRPWPWTLSIDGEAHYYPTREEALSSLASEVERRTDGAENRQLGVGLFQIEYRFHAHRFESVEAMIDPYANSRVAAEILSEGLSASEGDVWEAVGRFHSSTPEFAEAYRQRVAKRLVELVGRAGHGH